MMNSWPTPSIVIEDVDRKITRLDYSSPPRSSCTSPEATFSSFNKHMMTPSPRSPSAASLLSMTPTISSVIQPDVDAYVTPLSLCNHQPNFIKDQHPIKTSSSVSSTFKDEKVMVVSAAGGSLPVGFQASTTTSGSESSFTSVDIGGQRMAVAETSWNSWNDSNSPGNQSTSITEGCCFDIKSGLKSVTRVITGSSANPGNKCAHHRIDISDVINGQHPVSGDTLGKKRMTRCSIIGVVLLTVAIIGLIAVGIAMYIEFVTKPGAKIKPTLELNSTSICDFLLDSCNEKGNSTDSVLTQLNNTVVQNDTGRIEARFSTNFTSLLSKLPIPSSSS